MCNFLCAAALRGQGVYLACNSSYSANTKYSVPNKDGHQAIFICRFIVGKYALGKKGMKAPPPLKEGSKTLHDTLVDSLENPSMFVAMTDAQAYPEYLVTFKLEKKTKTR